MLLAVRGNYTPPERTADIDIPGISIDNHALQSAIPDHPPPQPPISQAPTSTAPSIALM